MRLSDKDLDRLSREAADQYDVEQNTSGWDKLQQKLDKHLPAKAKRERRRFLFFIWMLALLTGGGLAWILTGNHTRRDISLKEGSSEVNQVRSESDAPRQSLEKSKSREFSDDKYPKQVDDQRPVQKQQTLTADKPSTKRPESTLAQSDRSNNNPKSAKNFDKPAVTPGPDEINTKNGKPVVQKSRNKRVNDRGITKTATPPASIQPSAIEKNSVEKHDVPVAVSSANSARNELPGTKENAAAATAQNQQSSDTANQSVTESLKPGADSSATVKKAFASQGKSGFDKGLVVGVLGAPDMSNVKFTNTDKVGYNVGIQVDYRFSRRWSANAGIIYTKKNYTSQGDDFNPPKGSWIDNIKLDLVEGSCTMFDIPLNVRYDLTQGNRHRYFLSTGLSTYLMKEEEYHYYYQYTNGSPGYRSRTYASDEHHWLSILNISAGFEKKVSRRLSLQGEPYLKIPLSGIGYGNLKINSYGIYFSIRYNTGLLSGKK